MEGKERYTIESFEIEESPVIFDNKTQQIILTLIDYNYDEITHLQDLLNHYFKRIKELEEENGYIIFVDGYDENGNEIHRQEFVKYKDKFQELVEENKQLKQSQKQHVINILEDIMSLCRNGISDHYSLKYVYTIIDNQIKSLKGE